MSYSIGHYPPPPKTHLEMTAQAKNNIFFVVSDKSHQA